jgi:hypothetical protein
MEYCHSKFIWIFQFENDILICLLYYKGELYYIPQHYGEQMFFLVGIVGGGVQLGPLGTVATNGLLCQPRMIMMMEKLVEWLARETEVFGENLPQCRFVHQKPHMLPGRELGLPRWDASIQQLELWHGLIINLQIISSL